MRALAFLCLAALSGQSIAAETRYPVPDGATSVKHVRLADTAGEQDYFEIKLAYPSTSVLEHYRKVFSHWTQCKPNELWQSFGDLSGPKPRFVHQLLWEWVSADNRSVVTLGVFYHSDGVQHRAKPDGDTQHVVLIEYMVPDARAMAAQLGYRCTGA